jgi:hypothetical protein
MIWQVLLFLISTKIATGIFYLLSSIEVLMFIQAYNAAYPKSDDAKGFAGIVFLQCLCLDYQCFILSEEISLAQYAVPIIFLVAYNKINIFQADDKNLAIFTWTLGFLFQFVSEYVPFYAIAYTFWVYCLVPFIELPIMIGVAGGFFYLIEKILKDIKEGALSIKTKGKTKKQAIIFLIKETLNYGLLAACFVLIYCAKAILLSIHGYVPVISSVILDLLYVYPVSVWLCYPENTSINIPLRKQRLWNFLPSIFVFLLAKTFTSTSRS